MSGPLPDLSIIIPTQAARAASLQRVLAGLAQQALAVEWEVVVAVDGGAEYSALESGAEYPGPNGPGPLGSALESGAEYPGPLGSAPGGAWPFALRVVQGPREGPGATRNRGAAAARGAVLVFLDDDIVPAAGWAAGHWHFQAETAHRAVSTAEAGSVGLGRITLPARATRTPWERYLTARYDEHFVKMGRRGYAPTFWDCLSGSLSVRRAVFEGVGGFDPTFTRHEDVDLGLRLAEAGARFVYAPEATGEHQYRRGLAAGLADAVGEGESAGVLIRRHPALREQFVAARWRRYGPVAKLALRRVLTDVETHARALGAARAWLERVDASPLPFVARRPVYQWAYHLHFWEGMRRSAPEVVARVGRDGQ